MRLQACARGLAGLLALAVGCVSAQGGWDVEALLAEQPEIAAIEGQRIGDMTPFPALLRQRVLLVACRFETDRPVLVSGLAASARPDWLERTVAAVDDAVPRLRLVLEQESAPAVAGAARIEIVSVEDPEAPVPEGLADTLSECDVSAIGAGRPGVRGVLIRSEIRIRSAPRSQGWRTEPVEPEEWIGALLHEFGHALGFAGHAAVGDSLVLREEGRLRVFGRRVLAGQDLSAPNLTALYALEPGQLLGEVAVSERGQQWIHRVTSLVEARTALLGPARGPVASAGDRAARLRWEWPGGLGLELRFPAWTRELREGLPLTVVPGPQTQRILDSRSQAAGARRQT